MHVSQNGPKTKMTYSKMTGMTYKNDMHPSQNGPKIELSHLIIIIIIMKTIYIASKNRMNGTLSAS